MFGSAEETVDGDQLVGLGEEGDVVLVWVCEGLTGGCSVEGFFVRLSGRWRQNSHGTQAPPVRI